MSDFSVKFPLDNGCESSGFFSPSKSLSSFAFGYILRDTRALRLSASQRMNRFPASPLSTITWVFDGEIYLIGSDQPMPRISFSGPQSKPVVSYNPGAINALTLAIYPDAWTQLTGVPVSDFIDRTVDLNDVISSPLLENFKQMTCEGAVKNKIFNFEKRMSEDWRHVRPQHSVFAQNLQDWFYSILRQAAMSGSGRSLRQGQRRLKHLSGQTQRDLMTYVRLENLFSSWVSEKGKPKTNLSDLAFGNDFSDQSHMGREVKRLVGVSPAKFNQLIDSDESYWFYRLMGERY
ncbi:hypothetical protein NBRC116602_25310 [Hyphomicrobiales bacterium 4NK60-0047b]|jgi:AraC-like DNA-binding protein